MTDTRTKCSECNGRGVDGWGGTCLRCGGQGREPFREWGKEDDEDQPSVRDDLMKLHDETMRMLDDWVNGPVSGVKEPS